MEHLTNLLSTLVNEAWNLLRLGLEDEQAFVFVQLGLLALVIYATLRDNRLRFRRWKLALWRWLDRLVSWFNPRRERWMPGVQGAAKATLRRSEISLRKFGQTAGFAIVVAALINQTALRDEQYWLSDYSVLINAADVSAILYFCLVSRFGRIMILKGYRKALVETY